MGICTCLTTACYLNHPYWSCRTLLWRVVGIIPRQGVKLFIAHIAFHLPRPLRRSSAFGFSSGPLPRLRFLQSLDGASNILWGPQPHCNATYVSERRSGDGASLDGPLEVWLMQDRKSVV